MAVVALAALLAVGCGSSDGGSAASSDDPALTTRGYVVSSFSYVYPEHDEDPCPGGFTKGPLEMQLEDGVVQPDDCLNPESVSDPGFKTLNGPARFPGFDLDGRASLMSVPAAGECPHQDFTGPAGEPGFDYQLWRAIGCIRGFQKGELANTVIEQSVIDGSMTILIDLTDVDDESDDRQVVAQVFGSTDLPTAGANGKALPFATLSIHESERFHGTVGRGEIVDGVLLAGPLDINLRFNIQIVDATQTLRDAYLRMEFLPDGSVQGHFFGYQPIVEAYDIFGVQVGVAGASGLSYTCTGLWTALKEKADGHPNPELGGCSTISVAYRFTAVPAYIVK